MINVLLTVSGYIEFDLAGTRVESSKYTAKFYDFMKPRQPGYDLLITILDIGTNQPSTCKSRRRKALRLGRQLGARNGIRRVVTPRVKTLVG